MTSEQKHVIRRTMDLGLYGKIPYDSLQQIYVETADGGCVSAYQTKNSLSLGGWVYDAAICLAKYLESTVPKQHKYSHNSLSGKRVLELGAGPGIVGLFASYYGADSTLTDLESLLPLIEYNCQQNKSVLSGPICAKSLHWGLSTAEVQPPPDYLILANCVYYQSSLEPLRDTLLELAGPNTQILACYELRCPEIGKLIAQWHSLIGDSFDVEYVADDVVLQIAGSAYAQEFVKLAVLVRKPDCTRA